MSARPQCTNMRRPPHLAIVDPEPATLEDSALLGDLLGADPLRPDLAFRLINRFGGLGELLGADPAELLRMGATDRQAWRLRCVREAAIRLSREEASRRPVISAWSQLIAYVRTEFAHLPRERFGTLFLDKRNQLILREWRAEGSVDHAPVYPRELVRRALEVSASAMILIHNHPSGDPSPSAADIEMTRKVIDAARVFDIQVHDHVVVGRQGTASFKSMGLI